MLSWIFPERFGMMAIITFDYIFSLWRCAASQRCTHIDTMAYIQCDSGCLCRSPNYKFIDYCVIIFISISSIIYTFLLVVSSFALIRYRNIRNHYCVSFVRCATIYYSFGQRLICIIMTIDVWVRRRRVSEFPVGLSMLEWAVWVGCRMRWRNRFILDFRTNAVRWHVRL